MLTGLRLLFFCGLGWKRGPLNVVSATVLSIWFPASPHFFCNVSPIPCVNLRLEVVPREASAPQLPYIGVRSRRQQQQQQQQQQQ